MQTIAYRAYRDDNRIGILRCSRRCDDYPIIVNTAGRLVIPYEFKTDCPTGRSDHYLLYLKAGAIDLRVGTLRVALSPGDLVQIPPETPFFYSSRGTDTVEYYCLHFTGSWAQQLTETLAFSAVPCILHLPQAASVMDHRMMRLLDCAGKSSKFRDVKIGNCAETLLIELAECAQERSKDRNRLSLSVRYINDHYTEQLTVPALAAMEHLSVSRYAELFRAQMNVSPHQYIIRLRLSMACDVLVDSDLSIERIAELTGFRDSFYFSKLFKKHIGTSPLRYRKQAREQNGQWE